MTKKNGVLVFIALALAGAYAFYFTDWFAPKVIRISSINARALKVIRANANADSQAVPVTFKLGRPCKLTELKVVALDEWQTNKNCLPLWHLVADTNSAPITKPFTYGQKIAGMKPEVTGARPQPLQPGVKYRMFVTDGSASGQHDFQPVAKPASP
jgi:hypothetical protein